MACDQLPATLNLTIYQGATFSQELTWETGDPPEAVDLTGYSAEMKIKAGQTTLAELEDGDGITLGGVAGTITMSLPAVTTADLPPGNAAYDLLLSSSGGIVYPLVSGSVTIRASVTGG